MHWNLRHQDGYKGRDGNRRQASGAGLQIHRQWRMMLRVLMLTILLMCILSAGNKPGLGFVMAVLRSCLHPDSLVVTNKPALHPKHLRTSHDQNGQ
ncbi:MAG: hypothetical protein WAW39_25675 [Prosthecobacter sp.]|uniref:hypothetical protein n=1 Tax=Prosthecobacter sp. TaxID=1965333 RepID=UPI003BAEC9A7